MERSAFLVSFFIYEDDARIPEYIEYCPPCWYQFSDAASHMGLSDWNEMYIPVESSFRCDGCGEVVHADPQFAVV